MSFLNSLHQYVSNSVANLSLSSSPRHSPFTRQDATRQDEDFQHQSQCGTGGKLGARIVPPVDPAVIAERRHSFKVPATVAQFHPSTQKQEVGETRRKSLKKKKICLSCTQDLMHWPENELTETG